MTTVAARYCSRRSGAFIRNLRSFHYRAATLGSRIPMHEQKERVVGDTMYIKSQVHTASQTVLEEEQERLVGDAKRAESQAHHTASFGFREVPEEEKGRLVGDVFKSVASNYDLMNDIMSAGLHRLWKDRLVSKLSPFPGMQHLDVAGGTGDVAFRVLEAIHSRERMGMPAQSSDVEAKDDTLVYICDINPAMLNIGKKRAQERGLGGAQSLAWVEGDAEALSFQDNCMDGYTIAFGIRNVTHIDKALKEAYRVLKRGGHFLCLELSHVENPIFKQMYDFYSFSIIPRIGSFVAGDRASYQYLVESIRRFPSQEKFAAMIQEAGFQNVEYENLVGGVVAIHSGYKL